MRFNSKTRCLRRLVSSRTFHAGRDIVLQGRRSNAAYIVAPGGACSYKILPNGPRHIVNLQIPGKFIGLRSVLLWTCDHCVGQVTDMDAPKVLGLELLDAFAQTPRLAAAVL